MKALRTYIITMMLFFTIVCYGQSRETVLVALDEVKGMPSKIISAYFKPVSSEAGATYPLMQWYAFENKVDILDKEALTKLNASVYEFQDEPIKAAEFALQFCRSFGEDDFIANFRDIGFSQAEINTILRLYKVEKKWQELAIIKKWQEEGMPRLDNKEVSHPAKYRISIDNDEMNKILSSNLKRALFDDFVSVNINVDGTWTLSNHQYRFICISEVVPAQMRFSNADTMMAVPVSSQIRIKEEIDDAVDYRIKLKHLKGENVWTLKSGMSKDGYYWSKIKKNTPYYDYIQVAIEKLSDAQTLDNACQYEFEFSIGKTTISVSQEDGQEVEYQNKNIPYIRIITLHKKSVGETFFEKISLE